MHSIAFFHRIFCFLNFFIFSRIKLSDSLILKDQSSDSLFLKDQSVRLFSVCSSASHHDCTFQKQSIGIDFHGAGAQLRYPHPYRE